MPASASSACSTAAPPTPCRSRAGRSQTVGEIIDPGGSTDQTVSSDEPLEALLANLELRRLGGLVAVDADGRLTGVITLEQVGWALRDAAA